MNPVTQPIEYRALTITGAEVKALQSYFGRLVTGVERGGLYTRQTVAKKITLKEAVYVLFNEIILELSPKHNDGYTRLVHVGNRKGDNTPPVRIEIVLEEIEKRAVIKVAEATVAKVAEKVGEPAKDGVAKVESTEAETSEVK